MRIYVAGPLTSDTQEEMIRKCNVAIDAGVRLMQKGHQPLVPHLMQWLDFRAKKNGVVFNWQDYMNWCLVWLRQCEALLFLAPSKGANIELEEAKKAGMQIFYSVEEVSE